MPVKTRIPVPSPILERIKQSVVIPLKDAMKISDYKEHNRSYKFYFRKKKKEAKNELVFLPYSFILNGTLKHEMYLKAINPERIKKLLPKEYGYKLIITPNRPIDLDFESRNKRRIEIILYFKRSLHTA